jgi:hypothetical protein
MPVVLVDGVSASGKSIAIKKIQNRYSETVPNFSKLIITEHFTERYFEDKVISQEAVEMHIKSIFEKVISFKELQNSSRFAKKDDILTVYIERLLLTFYSRDIISEITFNHLANAFSMLGCKHYLLTIPTDKFKERLASSLDRRNQFWSEYINNKLGGLDKAVLHFQKQQDSMLEGSELLSKYMKTEVISVDDVESDFYTKIQ